MKSLKIFLLAGALIASGFIYAQRGKDGAGAINTAGRVVNEYTTLTADATAGVTTTITVAASGLNANGRFTATLAAGDLIMIIQMQGISVNGSSVEFPAGSGQFYGLPNDNTIGAITSYNNCGNYEFAEVNAVPNGTSITLDCALQKSYTSAGRVQVIRVPRYSSLTVTSPGTIVPQNWAASGFTGGIVAIEVLGNTTINNANGITASAYGFRGGSLTGDNVSALGGGQVARNDASEGAEKGEGVFGFQADYNAIGGRYARGAVGNAGGGANCHNAGGGGGANAGSLVGWDGLGNPDVSGGAGWVSAWNLEGGTFSTHTSPGGGRGGYSFANTDRDATMEGPKPFQSGGTNSWGGDYRINNGGWGGRTLDYSTGKLFIGGGGGAGDQDNSVAGAGGRGGGMVYLMSYGTVGTTSAGSITANGANGADCGHDGAGGGGGGGTIIVNSVGTVSGITITANGGNGGTQTIPVFATNQSEGPGGSGGGGYIAVSTGVVAQTVNPGANGISNSTHVSEFTPNGATRGAVGSANQTITNFTIAGTGATICSGNTASISATLSGTVPGGTTINWYAAQTGGSPIGTGSPWTTPVLAGTTTYYVGTCPGTYRVAVTVTVNPAPTITLSSAAATANQTVCLTQAITNITYTVGGSATGAGVAGLPAGVTGSFAAGTFTISGTPTATGTFNYTVTTTGGSCGTPATASGTITVNPNATITLTSAAATTNQTICLTAAITSITYSVGGGGTGAGVTGLPAGVTGSFSGGVFTISGTPTATGTFNYTVTTTGSCTQATASGTIVVNPNPTLTLSSAAGTNNQTVCVSTAITSITYTVGGGATGASVSGLPAGVAGSFAAGTYTISGTPTATGTFNYTVTTSGGSCTAATANGTITVNPNATITLSSAVGTNAQTVCQSSAITNITYTVGGGGTGAGVVGLPAGVTGSFAAGVFTISGTPTVTGTFNYTVTTTGTCTQATAMGTITVNPGPLLTLTSAGGTNAQAICLTSAITNITYSVTGTATGAGVAGLPAGVTGSFAAGVFTISGTPTATGTFNYTVTTTGGSCGAATATGTITVNPNATITLSSAVGTDAQTVCISTTITNITYTVGGGGTGAGVVGLPAGVTGSFAAGVFTISGIPTATGTFNYTVTTTGTCTQATAIGSITVNPNATITLSSAVGTDAQTLCVSTAITNITYTIGGGGTGAGVTGLPAGVTGSFSGGVFTISGTPTVAGPFTYTVTTTGTCTQVTATGSITVNPDATITLSSAAGTDAQTLCLTNPITDITYTLGGGATGAGVTGLPSGLFVAGSLLISGTPTVTGTFNYTVTTTGTCAQATATGTIIVNPLGDPTITNVPTVCVSAPSFNMSAATAGGTWSGTGITDGVNGTFDPATAGVGTWTITYTIAGSCGGTDTALVTVGTTSDATITPVVSVCVGAASFNMSAATPGGAWTGTGITDGVNGTFDPATAGIGSFVITYTISGTCGATDTATVTVTSLSNVTIANATPVCVGAAPFNLSAATTGGVWSGTGITDSINGTFDPATAGVGTFTVTYTLGGSCGNTDTALVTITPNSNPTINSPGSLCVGGLAVNLTAATSGGIWTGTGIVDSVAGTFDPATAGVGTFTITYTISGACGAVDTILITVNTSASATINNVAPVCVNGSAFNMTSATLGGAWTGTGITDGVNGTFNPATAGVGSFVITYTVSGSCSAMDTATIVVMALPTVTVNAPTICAGQTANLTAGGATTYSWSAGAISTGVTTADVTPGGTTTYTVTGTTSGCSNTAVSTVTVTPLPSITVNSPAICAGQTANLTANGGTTYVWSAGATSTGTATADATPASTTTYTVTGTASGCSNTATAVVTVNALPTPNITSNVSSGCGPLCVQFSETVSTICSSVSYDFGDGSSAASSDPLHCYAATGTYSVTITCTDANSCVGSTVIPNMITVDPTPIANFTISPGGTVAPNTPVTFTDISTDGGSQFWNFGDVGSATNTSVLSSDSHTYATDGLYCIELVSTNISGCADTVEQCIQVVGEAVLNVPNVFTPNGDGQNDMFFIAATGVRELKCSIYDRWGLKIAEWDTTTGGWDGRTTTGNQATDGVYYYILKGTAMNEKAIEQEGFLQLLSQTN